MGGSLFDIKSQLSFYGSYHNNKWNQLVHVIFVPLIWWSANVFVSSWQTDFFPQLNLSKISPLLILNFSFFLTLIYIAYYILLDFTAGGSCGIILFGMWLSANWINQNRPDLVVPIFVVTWIVGWTAQILAHKFFEGNSPALLDNLIQSILLAPLFVWFEVLFYLGFKRKMYNDIYKEVVRRIAQMKKKAH